MDNVEYNRCDTREDERAPQPITTERWGSGLPWGPAASSEMKRERVRCGSHPAIHTARG